MKTTNKILALALVAMVFVSCSKDDDDDQEVTTDYSKAILGMWEGVSMTGEKTYGDEEARILYQADGTYTYYKNYAGIWFPSENVDNVYSIDKTSLVHRWCPEDGADYISEWWNIDYIKLGKMRWTALRERTDGSSYATTFIWKAVNVPMDDKLLAKAQGSWDNVGTTFYFFKDGELVDKVEKLPVGEQTYYIYDKNKYRIIKLDDDGEPYVLMGGSWKVKGTTFTSVIEECEWPEVIGMEDRGVIAILTDVDLAFGFYEEGECYIADEDTPEYDHWLQLTRYKRK